MKKSLWAYQVRRFLAIPAYLSPNGEKKLKVRPQYNVQTFTSAPNMSAIADLRVNGLLYFLSGIDT
ncbi:MAG: hypothetical protein OYL97_22900 [Candidatus Poribacteria bacterium]|nr:hypothetical protein [Candidatus Poribacteria bacterium]